jgi:hypothetical protein
VERKRTHLSLVGRSQDGARLLLVDATGKEFTLDSDHRLRATLRGENTLGQLEMPMDGAMRPREIQTRVRAGETVDALADVANMSVDQVMVYASPVLAERAHRAERAQRASVRRKSEASGARTLGESVTSCLQRLNISTETAVWDSWRREDGRWQVSARVPAGPYPEVALFVFDIAGNFVYAENEAANWLIGDVVAPEELDQAPEVVELESRRRRPSAAEQIGPDQKEHSPSAEPKPKVTPPAARESFFDAVFHEPPDVYTFENDQEMQSPAKTEVNPEADTTEIAPVSEPPRRREVRKTRGRASVPSWDEIMFGTVAEND